MQQHHEQENWHTHHFRSMGSQISIWLEMEEAALAYATLLQAEQLFAAAEQRMTRFSPDSELSRLNAQPEQWVVVSTVLWQVINHALYLAEETNGLFDPTLLNALEAAGYDRSFDKISHCPSPQPSPFGRGSNNTGYHTAPLLGPVLSEGHIEQNRDVEGGIEGGSLGAWRSVKLDPHHQTVWLPTGVRLDLGGIGKGFTAQQVVSFLNHWGPCLVDAGGDVTAGDAPRDWPGWPVGIATPWTDSPEPRDHLCQLWLTKATLATSGLDYRRWQQQGKLAHHLIDPRTGQPASTDVVTASVLAAEATRAEAWATATLVAGTTAGQADLTQRELAGAFINRDGDLILTPLMTRYAMVLERVED